MVYKTGGGYEQVLQIERIHSRVQQPCKFIGTKESVNIRKVLNSYKIGLVHRQVRRFIVVMCIRPIPYSGVLFAF